MLRHRHIASLCALIGVPLAAQNAPCPAGPGTLYGIVAYQCANCGFRQELGSPPTYTFFAEPVVTETRAPSMVTNGDVIIAVDGNPITSQAGADRFAHPSTGPHTLTVRRGRERQDIHVDLRTNCVAGSTTITGAVSTGVGTGLGGTATTNIAGGSGSNIATSIAGCPGLGQVRLRGTAGSVATGEPAIYVDGVLVPGGRFGFAVSSRPVCRMEQTEGRTVYRYVYAEYPTISAVRPQSAADKAGLRAGDVIMKVEGKSVLDAPAGLTGADQRSQLHMTVRRDGTDIDVTMVTTP